MTVITMTREMGSLGKDVAAGVAEKMGMDVIHHQLIERDVADRMHLGESDVHRFLEGKTSLWDRWKIDKKKLSHYTAEEIYQFAGKDNVIIRGWGAPTLLRRIPHVIRIRVCAPMTFRVKMLLERLELKDKAFAEREIERNDAAHSRALRDQKAGNWENALNYDLVLNTERVPIVDCVEQVVALAQSTAFLKTPQSVQLLNDLVIESHIRNILNRSKAGKLFIDNLDITVIAGEVVVSGAVDSHQIGNELCEQVRLVSGAARVTNNLVILPTSYPGYSL